VASEIFYCSRCQTRLFGTQFLEGTAFRVRDHVACENCLGEIIAPLSLEEQQEILLQVKALKDSQVMEELPLAPETLNQEEFFELDSPEGTEAPATDDYFELDTPEKRASRTRKAVPVTSKAAAVEGEQNRAVMIFLICLVGIAGLGSFLYFNSNPEITPTPIGDKPIQAPYNPSIKTYGSTTGTDPRAEEAKALIQKAKDFAAANPIDFAGQQEAFKKALDFATGSSYGPDAKREYDGMLLKQKEILARDFDVIDKEVAAASEKEEFKAAMDRLEQSRTKYSVGEWTGGIDLRVRQLRNSIWKVLFPLRDKAVEAKGKKNDKDVKAVVDRVSRWNLPEFSRELDNALGGSTSTTTTTTTPTDLKPPSTEQNTYNTRWRDAMMLATQRNYDGALAALDKAGADLKEAENKAELAADVDILKKVQSLYKDVLQAISMWKRNEKIPVESLDENLSNARSEDPFLRSDPDKIEVVRGGAPFPIEMSEVTARSLCNLLRRSKPTLPEADLKTAGLFCLIEGDLDSARQNYSGPADAVPYKYWSLSSKIAEVRASNSPAAKRDLEARRLYFAAERGYADMKSRANAVQAYRDLLNQYPGTPTVDRRRSQIIARRDGAKDYVFLPDDMDGGGTFNKSGKQPKFGECWQSTADSDPSRGAQNYVNAQFYAFADVPYSCWAYVGACCIEVFTAYYQATDLTYTKGSDVIKIEPGSNASLPVRNSMTFLKKTHAEHGGTKDAKVWQWAELKLPKYTTAGVKNVRICTDQKGYGVTFMVVSATRGTPPNEAEMRSWIKKPDLIAPPVDEKPMTVEAPPVVEARDPSLIGHWKLDEAGATATDSSGRDNGGVLVNEPSRVPGKFGGAVALDGKERYVSIPNSEGLDRLQEGTFTLACWFKPNSKPGDPNDAAYAVFAKSAAHEGLTYNADQKFTMDHVLSNGQTVSAVTSTPFAPGNYYHIAGVVSRSEGSVRIYVNGKQEGSASFTPGGAAKDFKNETWKIGIAAPGAGAQRLAADGIVDDVRVYGRALMAGDLKTIAGIAGGNAPSVVITSPLPGEKFDPNATVNLTATVTPSDRIAKLEFYAGSTLLGSKTGAPWNVAWAKVAGGTYTIIAKATDRSGTVYASTPLTIKVGSPTLYRAINLGGGTARVGEADFEGMNAKKLSKNGSHVDLKLELIPPPDAATGQILRGATVHPQGTSVSLIDIPNGPYQIFLYVVAGTTAQTYDIQIGGRLVQARIQSGAAGTWQKLGPWIVDASGGLLEVAARGGEVNFCALEVWRVSR